MAQNEFPKTSMNKVNRLPQRGQYDKETIYAIVDEALICHVAFVENNLPFVLPIIHTRIEDTIYLHGAIANRMLNTIVNGNQICISVTLVDGIVFARSVFHHSMNYRSAVLFGKGRLVEDDSEKLKAFHALTNHIAKGRWEEARTPSQKEIDVTTVVAIEIESASAKTRTGPPKDDDEDYDLPVWAGVLPLSLQALSPIADEKMKENISIPSYIQNYSRK